MLNFILAEQDLHDIQKDVYTLCAKYYQIGLSIGIEAHNLDAIQYNNRSCDDAWTQTLLTWLRRNYDCQKHGYPSWRTLVLAIKSHNPALAEAIADKHSIGMCIFLIACRSIYNKHDTRLCFLYLFIFIFHSNAYKFRPNSSYKASKNNVITSRYYTFNPNK